MGSKITLTLLFLWGCAQAFAQQYPMPAVPDSIKEPWARADYATAHFWDTYDFSDTTLLRPDYAEQALSDFLAMLAVTSEQGRDRAITLWLKGATPHAKALTYFADMGTQYLHAEQSPLRNEDLYERLLRALSSDTTTDQAVRSRAAFRLKLFTGNKAGTVANDFAYTTADGHSATLHTTTPDRPTLLLFYDPACDQCRDLLFRLRYSSVINSRLKAGTLTLLAVYPENDERLWQETRGDLPANWLTATDHGSIQDLGSYDLSTMPAMYLLADNKTVVLKEATFHQLTETLTNDIKAE